MAAAGQSQSSDVRTENRWTLIGSVVLLAVLGVDVVVRVMLPGENPPPIADDLRSYYYPAYLSAYSRLLEEGLQLWNPHQLTGMPRAGAIQVGLFYPFHLLYAVMPLSIGMAVNALLHLGIVAVSAVVFARRLGLMWIAALLAGALIATRGHYVGMIFFPNMLEAATWMIPGCIAVLEMSRGRVARPTGLLALCTGMSLLAGYPQVTVYTAYLWGALLCLLLLTERAPPRGWLVALACLGCGVALGAVLGMIQMLPALELSQLGNRRLEPLTIEQMFPMRRPSGTPWNLFVKMNHLRGSPTKLPLYFGIVGLTLLPAAFFAHRARRLYLLLAALGVLLILFTMGPETPFFDLYLSLPLLDSFRMPSRMRFTIDFCFTILAAAGLDTILRQLRTSRSAPLLGNRTARFTGAGAAICTTAAVLSIWLWADGRVAGSIVYAIAVGGLMLWGMRSADSRMRAAVVGLVVLILAVVEITRSPLYETRVAYMKPDLIEVFHRDDDIMKRLRRDRRRTLVLSVGQTTPPLPRKLPSAQRFHGIGDYEPATTRRQSEYFTYLSEGAAGFTPKPGAAPFAGSVSLMQLGVDPRGIRKRRRLLELAGIRYVFGHRDARNNPWTAQYFKERRFGEILEDEHGNVLWRTALRLPRAYVVYHIEPAPRPEILLRRIARDGFDPQSLSYVEDPPKIEIRDDTPARGARAKILVDEPERVVLQADLAAPGMLVLADAHYPGWRASTGERELEIYAVNHLFRGVALPEGRHEIVFEYRPRYLPVGIAFGVVGLAACVLLIIWPRRR